MRSIYGLKEYKYTVLKVCMQKKQLYHRVIRQVMRNMEEHSQSMAVGSSLFIVFHGHSSLVMVLYQTT